MENVGKFFTFCLGVTTNSIINGYVFSKLWMWFVVPVFKAKQLTIPESIGILLMIGFVTFKRTDSNKDKKFWNDFLEGIIMVVLLAFFMLSIGYIVKSLI